MGAIFKAKKYYILFACIVYVFVPVYFVYSTLGKPVVGTDDADILFVYARNFIHGHGIVYNIGGEHVEGFSCGLYFLVCSLFYLFTPTPEKIILLYNATLAVASAILILSGVRKLGDRYNIPKLNLALLYCIYLVWIFINPLYFGWTVVSLMDAGTYSFLLMAAWYFLVITSLNESISKRQNIIISLLIFLIIICRPEGVLWGLVYLFNYALLSYRQKQKLLPAVKKMLLPITAYAGTMLALTLFRLAYFGYPLPNTYYTKVSSSFASTIKDGLDYFAGYVAMYSPVILIPVLLLLICVAYLFISKKEKTVLFYVSFITLSFIIAGIAIPVLEGGDHFKGFRFFQNIYPLLIVPFILLLFLFKRVNSFKIILASGLVFISLFFYFDKADWGNFISNNSAQIPTRDFRGCIAMEFNIARNSRENGSRLNDIFKGNLPVIGYGSAGGIRYGYEGIVYDMMGLNNTKLAHADAVKVGPKGHQSFNKKVFYQLAPDILMPTALPASSPIVLSQANDYYANIYSWDNLIFKNIFNDDEFKQQYLLAAVHNGAEPNYSCYGYFNKQYLQKLAQTGNFTIQVFNYNSNTQGEYK